MRPQEIEAWVHRIIERALKGQPIEDSRVELKAEWPADPARAARRIAGHANAARTDSILWVIGVDENACSVPGVLSQDVASWYASVSKQFDAPAPPIQSVCVYHEAVTVVALYFETAQAPYVVKNPQGGSPEMEVPWRAGTRVRSANRAELLTLLVPLLQLPEIEVREGWLEVKDIASRQGQTKASRRWELVLTLYIVPADERAIVIPFHRCVGHFSSPDGGTRIDLERFVIGGRGAVSIASSGGRSFHSEYATSESKTEVAITGPQQLHLTAYANSPVKQSEFAPEVEIVLGLPPVNTGRSVPVTAILHSKRGSSPPRWVFHD